VLLIYVPNLTANELVNYKANITMYDASESSSLVALCCPWWQCHKPAQIKMSFTTDHMFLVKDSHMPPFPFSLDMLLFFNPRISAVFFNSWVLVIDSIIS
jgi:hypothetical protein